MARNSVLFLAIAFCSGCDTSSRCLVIRNAGAEKAIVFVEYGDPTFGVVVGEFEIAPGDEWSHSFPDDTDDVYVSVRRASDGQFVLQERFTGSDFEAHDGTISLTVSP